MPATKAYLWHYAPFLRLLIPFIIGIIIQWYLPLSFSFLLYIIGICLTIILIYFFLQDKIQYQFRISNGLALNFLIGSLASCIVWTKDIRNNKEWFGHQQAKTDYLVVRLLEPLVEKQNSFKALADVQAIATDKKNQKRKGKIIVYFKKDSALKNIDYGSQIAFNKPLQQIKNSGNPGSFNYKQYCLLQGITHQVYLSNEELVILPEKNRDVLNGFLFDVRSKVVNIIREFIHGEKEQGLAEALLIGYKDDLDKNLVESYSNTGVVHIIAISGLHLGLIYWLLLAITKPMRNRKQLAWPRFIIIICCLWGFSLLAGAGPSVLRSAVMFTCIALGNVWNKKGSIYNTLALSAFILLAWNPFWLWDVGFQLSYSAVLSIIIFFRPVYNWFYIKNNILDWLWKLNAVTIAAQILTLPISVYHFHQFPLLFLLANLVAVPLSSLILIIEIILIVFSFIPLLPNWIGWLLEKFIWLMNIYIERLDNLSFAVWDNLFISIPQAILLLGFVASIGYWFIEKNKKAIWPALICLAGFFTLRTISFTKAYDQKELIVYNVPKHQAIDIIHGRKYWFIGDTDLQKDDFIRNFHLQPSRILHRIQPAEQAKSIAKSFQVLNRKVLIIDTTISFDTIEKKTVADLVILSKNPKLYINNLIKAVDVKQLVIDGSVPLWKAKLWKKDCDLLHLPYHDVSEKGAFVMKLW
jgi:competence protein ComEC